MTKYIIVTGGVISGVGKGVTTAALGKILKEHGYTTTLIKIDPYINYDAGTLRPTEHGEVWVTEDGGEIDQDLGTYERFMNEDIPKQNNITTGQIYKAVIDRERRGEYLGKTVQFIPHILDEIKQRIAQVAQGYEIVIVEVGGTVGDYENVPFLHAFKALEREIGSKHFAYILVTYLPAPDHIKEMKTKPTQQAIRLLGQEGIAPDFVMCRSKYPLDEIRRGKIEVYSNLPSDRIIAEPDIETIYQLPLDLEQEQLGRKLLNHFNLASKKEPDFSSWKNLVHNIKQAKNRINIAIIGKYVESGDYELADSYVSIYQALIHAGASCNSSINITWLNAHTFEDNADKLNDLTDFDGVIIPGGFGATGVEGKIRVIEYVRTHDIPYLGICYGMQLAAVEYARNVCDMQGAHTTEVDPDTPFPVIDLLPMQQQVISEQKYGGTMRLGAYVAHVKEGTRVADLYNKLKRRKGDLVVERHRHRYEVNPAYVEQLAKKGLKFSGFYAREDGTQLMEFLELSDCRFFIATQAHPEFKSRLGSSSPLFYGFVEACKEYAKQKQGEVLYQRSQISSIEGQCQ